MIQATLTGKTILFEQGRAHFVVSMDHQSETIRFFVTPKVGELEVVKCKCAVTWLREDRAGNQNELIICEGEQGYYCDWQLEKSISAASGWVCFSLSFQSETGALWQTDIAKFNCGDRISIAKIAEEDYSEVLQELLDDVQQLQDLVSNLDGAYAPLNSPTFTGTVKGIMKDMVGLDKVDNTSDTDKPISTAAQNAFNNKVDLVSGKGLSTNDYTTAEKNKLDGLAKVATTGSYNDLSNKPGSFGGKRTCRFVIGTSTAGWTASECDYLCDGVDDQVEINAAIQALPVSGGEAVVLDGTYNITSPITINKSNITLFGNGNNTVLKRMWKSTKEQGVMDITSTGNHIEKFHVDGNKSTYSSSYSCNIFLNSSSSNTITGITCVNNYDGIFLNSSSRNTITGNYFDNTSRYGIQLAKSNGNSITGNTFANASYTCMFLGLSNDNTIAGNTCAGGAVNGTGIEIQMSSRNTVTGNTCNDMWFGAFIVESNKNTIVGNVFNDALQGLSLDSSEGNTITGNTSIRGSGLPSDYTADSYTIVLTGVENKYNLVAYNNIKGKNFVTQGGVGNTCTGNKYT